MVNLYLNVHYNDVIKGTIASQFTSLTIVYSTAYSDADQRKHQSSASLAFVRGIHRVPVNSPQKWPVTRKIFPLDDVIMSWPIYTCWIYSLSHLIGTEPYHFVLLCKKRLVVNERDMEMNHIILWQRCKTLGWVLQSPIPPLFMQLDPDGQETWEGNNEMKLLIIFRIFQSQDQKVTYSIKKDQDYFVIWLTCKQMNNMVCDVMWCKSHIVLSIQCKRMVTDVNFSFVLWSKQCLIVCSLYKFSGCYLVIARYVVMYMMQSRQGKTIGIGSPLWLNLPVIGWFLSQKTGNLDI